MISAVCETNHKIFTQEQVAESTSKYFSGDELAKDTWIKKYALKGHCRGEYLELNPSDMHRRMAGEFARIEASYKEKETICDRTNLSLYGQTRDPILSEDSIFSLFDGFKYVIPQGSVMAMLGNKSSIGSLSNCIVLDSPLDSYGGICFTDQQLAQLYKRRCGCGIDISTLRPEGTSVTNAAGSSTGAVSFMERFSNTTKEVGQKGRRGALMISMDIRHPDIHKFICVKEDLNKICSANISIKINDDFMLAVKDGRSFLLKWPVDDKNPKYKIEIDARALWDEICQHSRDSAEPGIMFWDRHHYYSTSSVYPQYKNKTTNPCSEIAMQPNDSCRLICVNLFSFIIDPFTTDSVLDDELLYRVCYEAQRIGDDLVDLEIECIDKIIKKIETDPEPQYIKDVELRTWKQLRDSGIKGRRTGVGITGLADMIAAVGIKYDTEEALKFVDRVMKIKCQAEFDCSIDMAITRGRFDGFDVNYENISHFVKMMSVEMPQTYARMMKYGRRNISISTAAPTGTVSILTQTSSGCEPVYQLEYTRRKKINPGDNATPDETDEHGDSWKNFKVYHPKYLLWKKFNPNIKLEQSPYFNCTAHSIDWKKRIEMQAVLQTYITHSISSTINLPEDTSVDIIKQIYMYGWEKGLKGLTVYREGSRKGILISNAEKNKSDKNETQIRDNDAPKREDVLPCDIHYSTIGGQQWIFLVGLLKNRPYEIFGGERTTIHIPIKYKNGWIRRNGHDEKGRRIYDLIIGDINNEDDQFIYKHIQTNFSAIKGSYTRLISLQLRHGVPIRFIHEQLLKTNESDMMSFERGVSRVLKKYIGDGEKSSSRCPACKEKTLIYEENCFKCINPSCQFSGCS